MLPAVFGASEVILRGFGGVTSLNPSGTLVWDNDVMRSSAISDENLFFAYDMSSVTVDRQLYDFANRNNHATIDAGNFTMAFQTNLTPTDDAYTREILPTQVNGAGASFDVSSSSTSQRERGWVLWDLSSIPSEANISSAVVWMQSTATSLVWLRADNASAAWDETTITWNTEPSAGPFEYNGQQAASSPYWTPWNITPLAQEWQDGITSNFGLRFRVCRTNADGPTGTCRESLFNTGTDWFSSEHGTPGNRPGLLLDYMANATQDFIELESATFGSGRAFDGVDDIVNATLTVAPTLNFTWGVWFTRERTGQVERLLELGLWNDAGSAIIYLHSDDTARCGLSTPDTQIESDDVIPVSFLTSVFCRFGGTPATLQMWVNGVEQDDNDTFSGAVSATDLYMSRSQPFQGNVDEAIGFLDVRSDLEMVDLTTPQSQVVIGEGDPIIDSQVLGLIDAAPWIVVTALLGYLGYVLVTEFRKSIQ